MQLPQYERRPREIPRYKPELGYLARFANPYPSTLPQAKAPIGEAMGALADGLGHLGAKFQKAEDAIYVNAMLPKTITKCEELVSKYEQEKNPLSADYVSGLNAYMLKGLQEYYDDSDNSGYNAKKPEMNAKIQEKVHSSYVIPNIARATATHAKALQDEGVQQTSEAITEWSGVSYLERDKVISNIAATGQRQLRNTSINPFNTIGGAIGWTLNNTVATVQNNFEQGAINFDNYHKLDETARVDAIVSAYNNDFLAVDKQIDILSGLDFKNPVNVQRAQTAITGLVSLLYENLSDLENYSWIETRDKDGHVSVQAYWGKSRQELEEIRAELIKEGHEQGIAAKVLTHGIISNDQKQQIITQTNAAVGKLLMLQGRLNAASGKVKSAKTIISDTVKSKADHPLQQPVNNYTPSIENLLDQMMNK